MKRKIILTRLKYENFNPTTIVILLTYDNKDAKDRKDIKFVKGYTVNTIDEICAQTKVAQTKVKCLYSNNESSCKSKKHCKWIESFSLFGADKTPGQCEEK